MPEPVVVFATADARVCSDRALVLQSLGIPHEILRDADRLLLIVPDEVAERAKYELWQYEQENRPPRPRPAPLIGRYQDPVPGVLGYVLVLCGIGWLAGRSAFGLDWLAAGRIDGAALRAGEWWRAFTALTLHGGVGHLLGNLGFGALFGGLAARLLGSGITWLAVVLAAGAGNALNVLLLESTHRSVGASTAVFAALGLLAGFAWRARLMAQDRWAFRLGPLIGGIALLAYTGTGDAQTDIGAHLSGFLCGFAGGTGLTFVADRLEGGRRQAVCGIAALAVIVLAWVQALVTAAAG
ncbi:MAG TPA: rhomboid family intramembrane serine protease [Woeseiaceae bacterium]